MANTTTLWQRLTTRFPRFGAQKRATVAPQGFAAGIRSFGGARVSSDQALRVTAFYAAVRIIAENLAALPKHVMQSTDRGLVSVTDHQVHQVIDVRPNAYTNVFSFWFSIFTWIKGWGNAYAIIKRDAAGNPVELHQVHPSNVTLTIAGGRKWYKVKMSDHDFSFLDGVYSDENILHFMEMSLDGIIGVNPVLYNAAAIGKSIAMDAFASNYFERGGNLKGVFEMENSLGDEAYEQFKKHIKDAGEFGTPLLEYGIKYKNLPVDPVTSDLVNSEVLSIQDICRIVNIPPHMVAELSHATFSNIEHQTIQFVQYSLRPIVKRIEVELENKLFFTSERGSYHVKFVLDGLLRGDTSARSAYYHNAILDGYMSRNEVRELEGMDKREGLDEYLYPLNTGIVGKETENENE